MFMWEYNKILSNHNKHWLAQRHYLISKNYIL